MGTEVVGHVQSANYSLWAKSSAPPVLVNEDLWALSGAQLLSYRPEVPQKLL